MTAEPDRIFRAALVNTRWAERVATETERMHEPACQPLKPVIAGQKVKHMAVEKCNSRLLHGSTEIHNSAKNKSTFASGFS